MKIPSILLISVSTLIVSSLTAQNGALPPMPGFVPAGSLPGSIPQATPDNPPSPAPAAPDLAETSTVTEQKAEDAAPEQGNTSAEPSAVSAAPGDVPPGLPGTDPSDKGKKVDFMQRSNLILAKLLESERAVDPFGLVMDPANAKTAPLLSDQYQEVDETPALNNTSLKSALLTLPITGIYPQREQIVLGARSFTVGGQFGMKHQDLTIRLRFEGIRNGEIFFKDMETREVTSIPFNPRPAEFEPMAKGSKREAGAGILPMNDLFIAN